MKVELFRQSKAPVDLNNFKLYQEAWIKFFDAVQAKYGLNMEKMHKLLEYADKKLSKKYNGKVEIDFPSSAGELDALCTHYGTPIMFAQRTDGLGLVAVVMDDFGSQG